MFKIKDKEIETLIKGKRVVVLGSAPSVLNNDGKNIDSYDIVVRVNNFKIDGFEDKVGRKLDIYYSFFGRSIKKENDELKRHGLKFIMCKYPNEEFLSHTGGIPKAGISDGCKWVYELRKDWWQFPLWIPKMKYFKQNFEKIFRIPTTGVSAILDVLRFEPKELYVTGFDFMTSGYHNTDEKWNDGDGNHNHAAEMYLIASLKNKGAIKCDNHIENLIKNNGVVNES